MMTLLRYAAVMVVSFSLLALAPIRGNDVVLEQKLKSIVVSVDMTNAKIDQAIANLAALSNQLDPDRKGIQFVISPDAATTAKPVTLKLDNVPMKDVLKYVCELSETNYKINEHSIAIVPRYSVGAANVLIQRTFQVDPSFVHTAVDAGVIPAPKSQ